MKKINENRYNIIISNLIDYITANNLYDYDEEEAADILINEGNFSIEELGTINPDLHAKLVNWKKDQENKSERNNEYTLSTLLRLNKEKNFSFPDGLVCTIYNMYSDDKCTLYSMLCELYNMSFMEKIYTRESMVEEMNNLAKNNYDFEKLAKDLANTNADYYYFNSVCYDDGCKPIYYKSDLIDIIFNFNN